MLLDYPAWCSAIDRAVIDAAVGTAGLSFQMIVVGRAGGPRVTPDPPRSESAAVQQVAIVAKVAKSRLIDGRQQPALEERLRGANDLLAQIIVRAAVGPLPAFEAAVHDALRPWWPVAAQIKTTSSKGRRARAAGLFRNRAQWLTDHLQALALSRTGLAILGGPDSHTTKRVLEGYGVDDHVISKLAQALTEAYHRAGDRDIRIRPEDIPRD